MSIIFKKLKSLENTNSHDELMESNPQQERKIYALKKKALSTSGLWIIISAISSFVVIIFISLFFLRETIDSDARRAVVVQIPHLQQSYAKQSSNDSLADANIMASASGSGTEPVPVPGNESRKDAGAIKDAIQAAIKTAKEAETGDKKTGTGDINGIGSESLTCIADNIKRTFKITSIPKSIVSIKKQVSTITNIHKTINAKEKKKRKNKKKFSMEKTKTRVSIEELSYDLGEAFQEQNTAKTNKLLARIIHFIRLKKSRNNYYFKLMAFKAIRNARYDLARKFLNKVLTKNKNDFEAGMNMAVIEIKQNKYKKAKKRLIRLKKLYPSRTEIDTLLNQL